MNSLCVCLLTATQIELGWQFGGVRQRHVRSGGIAAGHLLGDSASHARKVGLHPDHGVLESGAQKPWTWLFGQKDAVPTIVGVPTRVGQILGGRRRLVRTARHCLL